MTAIQSRPLNVSVPDWSAEGSLQTMADLDVGATSSRYPRPPHRQPGRDAARVPADQLRCWPKNAKTRDHASLVAASL